LSKTDQTKYELTRREEEEEEEEEDGSWTGSEGDCDDENGKVRGFGVLE
jgi:hypothetical protein